MLLETLKSKAVERGLLKPDEEIDAGKAFLLVRDMPYTRALISAVPNPDPRSKRMLHRIRERHS